MSFALQAFVPSVSTSGLDGYIQYVNKIPMLSAEEEIQLAKKFRETNDLDAARSLVLAHLRYVVRVARGYLGYGLPLNDLIQEGNIGLMKAVKRFDPTMGVRLVSFAVHWIKSEIHEFVIQNWRIVKIATTKAQRKLFFNLRSMKKRLGWMQQQDIDVIAKDLGVSREEVIQMEQRLNASDASIYIEDSDEPDAAISRQLHAPNADPALIVQQERDDTHQHTKLLTALNALDDRSQDILRSRWLQDEDGLTLHDLAEKYGVSAERIRQLEKSAMEKLKLKMLA